MRLARMVSIAVFLRCQTGRGECVDHLSVATVNPTRRFQLRRHPGRANGMTVQRSIIRILLICAMMFGGIAAPAVALSQSLAPLANIEAADVHCDTAVFDEETSQAHADAAGGHHHHCGHGIAVPDIALTASVRSLAVLRRPTLTAVLRSYSQAPPTEPPSA